MMIASIIKLGVCSCDARNSLTLFDNYIFNCKLNYFYSLLLLIRVQDET